MSWELIGFTIGAMGKLMIAYTALMVNHRFLKEHKIDEKVFKAMSLEQKIGIVGIIFIITGYVIEVSFKL